MGTPNTKTDEGGFEPIALQGHNVIIHHLDSVFYRKVDFWEAIPPFQIVNLGALAAGVLSNLTNLTNLDMPDDEFGQFRWWVLDNAQVRFFLPSGLQKAALKFITSVYDLNTPLRDPNLVSTEVFVWEDNRPAVVAVNGQSYALNAVRLVGMGYRFHTTDLTTIINDPAKDAVRSALLTRVKAGMEPATHIWTSGRGQG